jgi:hypothetical protein
VNKAIASITIGGLAAIYDGTAKAVTVTTFPAGLSVVVTYNGSIAPPTAPGSYAVIAVVNSRDYVGAAAETLVITTTVLSRHAPTLQGRLDGSAQMLRAEDIVLSGGSVVSGDLLVPGTPHVVLNGDPDYLGTIDGVGNRVPSNYMVTLQGDAALRHVVRATDPVAFPTVPKPPAPVGTRNVMLRSPGESAGDFSTVRDLTLKDDVGQIAVPAGTYGAVTANTGSGLTIGVAGAAAPVVYNLQALTLTEGSMLEVVGPVILNIGSPVTVSGAAGNAAEPRWLTMNVSSGGVTVNGASIAGYIVAPAGTVTINTVSLLRGGVVADRLVVKGGGTVEQP